jgi:cytochrome c peroxidase
MPACKKSKNDTAEDEQVSFSVPANFPAPEYNMTNNPVTTAGFKLGRKLFYDVRLSRDNSTSCGSCHIQYSAFTHHGHVVSHGIDNKLGTRNSPPVMNMAWNKNFMWDGGIIHLDLLPITPITNPVEMDETVANVLEKLKADKDYPAMFKAAFGTEDITTANTFKAMSQFMNMLISANSRYDKWIRNEGGQLSADEEAGYNLFKAKCSTCHSTDLFTDGGFHNNGLYVSYTDKGRAKVTEDPNDEGKFKTPSLRNVEKTPPYMHNGSKASLESVLQHYASGVKTSATLDHKLQENGNIGIPLTDVEQAQIIAFLKTLTDDEFIRDRRFSEQ